jgi:hypothetical protein
LHAPKANFSSRREVARRRRLALAPIEAERDLEPKTMQPGWRGVDALRGDWSGRGLYAWCERLINVCKDQVKFIGHMLTLDGVRERFGARVAMRAQSSDYPHYAPAMVTPLHRLCVLGPTPAAISCG